MRRLSVPCSRESGSELADALRVDGLVERALCLGETTVARIVGHGGRDGRMALTDILALARLTTDADLLQVATPSGKVILVPLHVVTQFPAAELVLPHPTCRLDSPLDGAIRLVVPRFRPGRSEWPVASIRATTFQSFVG